MTKYFNFHCFTLALWAFILLKSNTIFGQCQCNDILKHGIYDYRNISSLSEASTSFISWYKNQNIQTFSSAKNATGKAIIPLQEVMIGLGFSYDEEGFKKFQSYVESYTYKNDKENLKIDQVVRTINPNIIAAWDECIKLYGLHVWIEHTSNPYEFALCANFIDDGGGGKAAQITAIDFGMANIDTKSNLFYNNGKVNENTILSATIMRQIFTRKNRKAFNIAVNVSRGQSLLYSFQEITLSEDNCENAKYNSENKQEGSMLSSVKKYNIKIAKPHGNKCVKLFINTRWDGKHKEICSYKVKLLKGEETIREWNRSEVDVAILDTQEFLEIDDNNYNKFSLLIEDVGINCYEPTPWDKRIPFIKVGYIIGN